MAWKSSGPLGILAWCLENFFLVPGFRLNFPANEESHGNVPEFDSLIIHPWRHSQPALVMSAEQRPSVEKERKESFLFSQGSFLCGKPKQNKKNKSGTWRKGATSWEGYICKNSNSPEVTSQLRQWGIFQCETIFHMATMRVFLVLK